MNPSSISSAFKTRNSSPFLFSFMDCCHCGLMDHHMEIVPGCGQSQSQFISNTDEHWNLETLSDLWSTHKEILPSCDHSQLQPIIKRGHKLLLCFRFLDSCHFRHGDTALLWGVPVPVHKRHRDLVLLYFCFSGLWIAATSEL